MMQVIKKDKEIANIYEQLNTLLGEVESFGQSEKSVNQLERDILKRLLMIGLHLIILAVRNRHNSLERQGFASGTSTMINKGINYRSYTSVFGTFDFPHRKYYIKGKGIYYPLDTSLSMPKGKLSYVLEDWLGKASTDLDYRESVRMLNEILGLNLTGRQSKHQTDELGRQVEEYYEQVPVTPVVLDHWLCLEWDGKGVPIIKEQRQGAAEQKKSKRPKADLAATSVAARLKKGKKRGIKKTATVSVVSDFKPKERTKESIIRGLFKSPLSVVEAPKQKSDTCLDIEISTSNNWHQNIHRRAFMDNQQKAIKYGVQRAKRHSLDRPIPIVALIDGGVGLENQITTAFEQAGLSLQLRHIILDIVHVSEYVWKAANAILGENSKLRTNWVKEMLSDILDSKVAQVIKDLEANRDKTQICSAAKQQLDKIITYFTNHQHKMDYKTYLEKGLPVSTALVESSCGHLVKDRMERSGMRWSMQGAQNMMDARAVKKNGDWNNFMEFFINKNQQAQQKKAA